MSSIVPGAYPRTPKPKPKRPSYGTAIAWIAEHVDGETLHDTHMTVRLAAAIFGRDVRDVYGDVQARRLKEQR